MKLLFGDKIYASSDVKTPVRYFPLGFLPIDLFGIDRFLNCFWLPNIIDNKAYGDNILDWAYLVMKHDKRYEHLMECIEKQMPIHEPGEPDNPEIIEIKKMSIRLAYLRYFIFLFVICFFLWSFFIR